MLLPLQIVFFVLLSSIVLVSQTLAGTIRTYGSTPIDTSVSNKNQNSDYTFSFTLETDVEAGGRLEVTFPTQYTSGLGFSGTPTCTVPCSVSGYVATFTFNESISADTPTEMTIEGVKNPTSKGGTGNFELKTYKGVNNLDINLIFGVIGIADSIGTLTSTIVSLDSFGTSKAGKDTRYTFDFKVSQDIPSGSYLKFTVTDTKIGLTAFPACNANLINGKIISGKLKCETEDRDIYVYGLTSEIEAEQDVSITVSMKNPRVAGITSSFTMALLRAGTNLIYDRKVGAAGVTIQAGEVSDINFEVVNSYSFQAKKKLMDYILDFTLTNALSNGEVITIEFPPTFAVDSSAITSLYYIRYGLEDVSETSTVSLTLDANNVLTIQNFKTFKKPQEISLYLRMINPDNVGETTPAKIRSYTSTLKSTLIDEDIVAAKTIIESQSSFTTYSITTAAVLTNTAIPSFEFLFTPIKSIVVGGHIDIYVPSSFKVADVDSTMCRISPGDTGVYVDSASCYNIDNYIRVELSAGFALSVSHSLLLENVLTTPNYEGIYLFDVTTYGQADGITISESQSFYYEVDPQPFQSFAVTNQIQNAGAWTILEITFENTYVIPAGRTQQIAQDTKGYLEVTIRHNDGALGTGKSSGDRVACRAVSGITALTDQIKCYIYPDTVAPYDVVIRVENFEEIAAETLVTFEIAKIANYNAAGTYPCSVKAISKYNRRLTTLHESTFNLNIVGAAASPAAATTYTIQTNEVSTYFNITFNTPMNVGGASPGTMLIELPYYDTGFVPFDNSIRCLIGATLVNCIKYELADFIAIPLSFNYVANTAITIRNLRYPRYQKVNLQPYVTFINTATNQIGARRTQVVLPTASVPEFQTATILVDKKDKGAVDATYQLVFTPYNEIPEGASVKITLPSTYDLLASDPAITFGQSGLTDISTTQTISYSASILSLTVTNFQAIPALSSFSIIMYGVKNPSSASVSQTWVAEVYYLNSLMVQHNDFDKFTFLPAQSNGFVTFTSIEAFPTNADVDADYDITFVPSQEIPIGGEIQIELPQDNFKDLPTSASCAVSGGITTFESCTIFGNVYTIVLDTRYTLGSITVTLKDLPNPDKGTTDGFIVSTYYDGVYLDLTDSSDLSGRTITITDNPTSVDMQELSMDPENEGEIATYTVSFVPENPVQSTMTIMIRFPDEYDPRLGDSISCESTSGLIGDIECEVSDRAVYVTGFETYLPEADRPITIQIFGITNPNQLSDGTGEFNIGTFVTGEDYFQDFLAEAGTLSPVAAPGWATIYAIEPANLYTRYDANYYFSFFTTASIPRTSSEGAILIEYPNQFELEDGDVTCDTTVTDFALSISCEAFRNRVSINGHTQDYSGELSLYLRNVENPTDPGLTDNIEIKTYDGTNQLIIERSFRNLDPFTFYYEYPGPLIYVNGDNGIEVQAGTQTNDLYVSVDFPSALNLTIKPQTPGFSIIPFNIDLSLGTLQSKFRVSVPESYPAGTYYVEWVTLGELIPPKYTPIKKTEVVVTRGAIIQVEIPTLNEIPYGGNSLPAYFRVANGPDIGFEIKVNFLVNYPGISLSTTSIKFNAGDEEVPLIVSSSSDTEVTGGAIIEKGTIVLSIEGINEELYELPQSTMQFSVTDQDKTPPTITSVAVQSVTKNEATIVLYADEKCMVYYMIALQGTEIPLNDELVNQGPAAYTTTKSVYGVAQIDNIATPAEIEISGLIAETPYSFYVLLKDQGDNFSDEVQTYDFETDDRYNAAEFSLSFERVSLSEAEKQVIINGISFVLSQSYGKVIERKYTITDGRRMLGSDYEEDEDQYSEERSPLALSLNNSATRQLQDEVFVSINLQLKASPDSTVFPSPLSLAQSLNEKVEEVQARLENYDTTQTVEPQEFNRYTPAFPQQPVLTEVFYYNATFRVRLSNYGYVFIVCIKVETELTEGGETDIVTTDAPSPYQISNSLNSKNILAPGANVEISKPYTDFSLFIDDLEARTNYIAYIVGGSAHPGYPDLMDEEDVVVINFITEPAPTEERLNINAGQQLDWKGAIVTIASLVMTVGVLF